MFVNKIYTTYWILDSIYIIEFMALKKLYLKLVVRNTAYKLYC